MAVEMAHQDLYAPSFRDFVSIRYAFLKAPRRPDQREIFHGANGVNVYENPNARPRAWAQPIEQCDHTNERVDLERDSSSGVRIAASLNCRAMVILTDTWAPGWRATVDGRPATIERAFGIVRGIV